ncbi:MAG: DUF6049 family protein [Candidatus Nanopelagicales bacterium]
MKSYSPLKVSTNALAYLVAFFVAASVLIAAPAAQADDPVQPETNPGISGLEVAITALRPLNPQPKRNLVVSGAVTNRSDNPIDTIQVNLSIGQSPVTSVQSVIDLDSNTSIASTRALPGGQVTQSLGSSGGLAPGGSTPFKFTIPFKEIALGSSGIYALQVQASDVNDSSHFGFTQTFLPWYPKDREYKPINLLVYWPLATIPNKTSTNLLMTDQTPASVDTNGRLNGLISVPNAKNSATWVVDPSLIQTVATIANGYEYLNDQNEQIKGTHNEAAANWLARAKQTLNGSRVLAMPYAHSDTTALVANNMRSNAAGAIRSAASTLSTDLGTAVTQSLTWLPEGRMSPGAMNFSSRAGSMLAVVSRNALLDNGYFDRSRNPMTKIETDRDLVPGVVADPDLSAAFAQQADEPADQVRLRQRIFALIGAWPASQEETSIVVAPPTLWAPNTAVLDSVLKTVNQAEWVKAASQDEVIETHLPERTDALREPTVGTTTGRSTANYFQVIASAQRSLQPFNSVLSNGAEYTNPMQSALLRAESTAWQGNRRNGRALLETINQQISQGKGKLRAVASEVVSVSGDSGSIPITLINDFDQPATIKVRLDATPSVRLESDVESEFKIPAKRKTSVEIPVKVVGSEDLPVNIQLVAPDGSDWGSPEEISVRSSAYARAATWVVIAAFALLVILLAINSIRRRRADKAPTPEQPEPTDDSENVHQLDNWRDHNE